MNNPGYHQSNRFLRRAEQGRLMAMAYVRPDTRKALLVLANWQSEPVTTTLELDASALGLREKRIARVEDLEGNPPPEFSRSSLSLTLPGNDFLLILLE